MSSYPKGLPTFRHYALKTNSYGCATGTPWKEGKSHLNGFPKNKFSAGAICETFDFQGSVCGGPDCKALPLFDCLPKTGDNRIWARTARGQNAIQRVGNSRLIRSAPAGRSEKLLQIRKRSLPQWPADLKEARNNQDRPKTPVAEQRNLSRSVVKPRSPFS